MPERRGLRCGSGCQTAQGGSRKGCWQNTVRCHWGVGEAVVIWEFNTLLYAIFRLRVCLRLAITISDALAPRAILMPIKTEAVCKSGSPINIHNSWWNV